MRVFGSGKVLIVGAIVLSFVVVSVEGGGDLAILNDEFDSASTLSAWRRINAVEGWNADQLQVWDINGTQAGRMVLQPYTSTWFRDYRGVEVGGVRLQVAGHDVEGRFRPDRPVGQPEQASQSTQIPGTRRGVG